MVRVATITSQYQLVFTGEWRVIRMLGEVVGSMVYYPPVLYVRCKKTL